MSRIHIAGCRLVLPDRVERESSITIRGDLIESIGGKAPADAELIEAKNKYVLPGLIDVHGHGRLALPNPETAARDLEKDRLEMIASGVTRFLVTFASAPLENWMRTIEVLEPLIGSASSGARPMGFHLEGVFLNPAAAGAQPPGWIKPFDVRDPEQEKLFRDYAGRVRIQTLAPEVPGNEKLAELCLEKGIVPSLGHSAASPSQVKRFADMGVIHATHLFNGMKVMDHRDPGPAIGALMDDRMSVDFICDGFHVHPEVIPLIHKMKAPDKRILITDSVTIQLPGAQAGGPDEPNRLPDGRLAGSRLRLHSAIGKYKAFTGCSLPEATAMASLNPARLLGMDMELGSLEPGKTADFWISGEDLEPEAVYIAGERQPL